MRIINSGIITFIIFISVLASTSCSRSGNIGLPTEPVIAEKNITDSFSNQNDENRCVIAVYDVTIDPLREKFDITPSVRYESFYFNLSSLLPNVLKVINYNFGYPFTADIQLTHPLPGSGIDVFDPRIIAIIPANPGVSMNYPLLDVSANNSAVLNPDGYSKLWDKKSLQGNTNPFISYFKEQPYRRWSSIGYTQEIKRWRLDLSGFGEFISFSLVVDISTNYPRYATPVVDNAISPLITDINMADYLRPTGSSPVEITILDWQGPSNTRIIIEAPQLSSSLLELVYKYSGPEENEYVYSAEIPNNLGAPVGNYRMLVAAMDETTGICNYQEFSAKVVDNVVFNPVFVTPPWLNMSPLDVCLFGNYACVVSGIHGVHFFDVSNPSHPFWISRVDTAGFASDVEYFKGYVFVTDGTTGVLQIDVSNPYIASIVKTIDTSGTAVEISISDGFAYVADSNPILLIYDIDPPVSTHYETSFNIGTTCTDIFTQAGYAYAIANGDCYILNIQDLDNVFVVKQVIPAYGDFTDVFIKDQYAYFTGFYFEIYNVSAPESAYFVNKISNLNNPDRVAVSGDYAFVSSNYWQKYFLIKISPPELACVVSSSLTAGPTQGIVIADDMAFITSDGAFQISNVENPQSPYILKTIFATGKVYDVETLNGYAYLISQESQLIIIDVHSPEEAHTIKPTDEIINASGNLFVDSGYGYTASTSNGLRIVDIAPPESAHYLRTVDTPGEAMGVCACNGYAYVADNDGGIQIICANLSGSAYIVKNIPGSDAMDVFVSRGYMYALFSGLRIYDVAIPEAPVLIKNITSIPVGNDVKVVEGYLYAVTGSSGFYIYDIDPPENTNLVKYIDTPDHAYEVCIKTGYAFIADRKTGMIIIDVVPPETAYVVATVDTPGEAWDVSVLDNYAYIADRENGLQIVKLW